MIGKGIVRLENQRTSRDERIIKSARIMRSVLETRCHSNSCVKLISNSWGKNFQKGKIIIIIIIIICNKIASLGSGKQR